MELHAAQLPPQVLKLKTHAISDSSRAAARQRSLSVPLCMMYITHHSLISAVYQMKVLGFDNSSRLTRRVDGFGSRAPIMVSDSEDADCALHVIPSNLLQTYSRFIDSLHRRCGMQKAGVHKEAVQAALRMNLQCTFASWIQLSPTQKDALYVQALQILRTLSEFLKVCVTDLEQVAAEYKDAGNDAAAEEMLQQLTSVLHPQYSSEDELEEVKCEQEDSAAAQQVLLGGGSSNSGGGGNAPHKRGAADEQPVMAPASARDRFSQHSLKKMGMRGAWGTGTAEQRNISKYG